MRIDTMTGWIHLCLVKGAVINSKPPMNRMKKLSVITCFVLIPLAPLHAADQPPIKRNILHIHADDHRPDGLQALGNPLLHHEGSPVKSMKALLTLTRIRKP